jgi:hypothetical protein
MMMNLKVTRGRDSLLRSDSMGFEPVSQGRMIATVFDPDDDFDPYNISSRIYPYVRPGAKFKLYVKDNTNNAIYNIMLGDISDVIPDIINKTAVITGNDRLNSLNNQFLYSGLRMGWSTSVNLEAILTTLGWADGSDIDAGGTAIPFWWSAVDDATALDDIQYMADAELSTLFIANDGKLKYYLVDKAQVAVETITDADILKDIELALPWENVKNDIRITYCPRGLTAGSVDVWELGDNMYLESLTSIDIYTTHEYGGELAPCYGDIVFGTKVANALATDDPGYPGADMSAFLTATLNLPQDTLSRKVTLSNTHPTDGLYITSLKAQGRIAQHYSKSSYRLLNDASVALCGPRIMSIDNIFVQSIYQAVNVANDLAGVLTNPAKISRIRFVNSYALQFTPDLFDVVYLNITDPTITSSFRVGAISHEWLDGSGNTVLTTMRLEPYLNMYEEGDFMPVVGDDDCYVAQTLGWIDKTSTSLMMGDSGGDDFDTGVLFRGVLTPQGKTIVAAWVEWVATNDSPPAGTCQIIIRGELNDTPVQFSTFANYNARTRTTAFKNWYPGAWVAPTVYYTVDITPIVQEIVNLPGWVAGHHMVLFFAGGTSDVDAYRIPAALEHATLHEAILYVRWLV